MSDHDHDHEGKFEGNSAIIGKRVVVPITVSREGVFNGKMKHWDELVKMADFLEGRPVSTILEDHPTGPDGSYVPLSDTRVISGTIRNVKLDVAQKIVRAEAHLIADAAELQRLGWSEESIAKHLTFIERIRKRERIEGSLGYWDTRVPESGAFAGNKYEIAERNIFPDHFITVTRGACGVKAGCGWNVDGNSATCKNGGSCGKSCCGGGLTTPAQAFDRELSQVIVSGNQDDNKLDEGFNPVVANSKENVTMEGVEDYVTKLDVNALAKMNPGVATLLEANTELKAQVDSAPKKEDYDALVTGKVALEKRVEELSTKIKPFEEAEKAQKAKHRTAMVAVVVKFTKKPEEDVIKMDDATLTLLAEVAEANSGDEADKKTADRRILAKNSADKKAEHDAKDAEKREQDANEHKSVEHDFSDMFIFGPKNEK